MTPAALALLLAAPPPPDLAPFFRPPAEHAGLSAHRSPLVFDDGTPVKAAADWPKRRAEILAYWHRQMGPWPEKVARPKVAVTATERRDGYTQQAVTVEVAPGRTTDDAYLLAPDGPGPFPAVLVVYYDAKTGAGLTDKKNRDFALQLAKRGFVALSLGSPTTGYYPTKEACKLQPLSYHAYVAGNGYRVLAAMPNVDPKRVGVVGHSYGGKWAMFASCLNDEFACGVWSDGGVVFDERRSNVNYWEPWYLGFDPALPAQRKAGILTADGPRTGPYKQLVADGRDLQELHALMAPRPFLVSGGAEDGPARWKALNHAVAVNTLLGVEDRVAMTNRPAHGPTEESNGQLCRFFEWALKPGKE